MHLARHDTPLRQSQPRPIAFSSSDDRGHHEPHDHFQWEEDASEAANLRSCDDDDENGISLAELAFWLGDADSGRLECPCDVCWIARCNETSPVSSQVEDAACCPVAPTDCMDCYVDLHIPPTFYTRLAPLIPVIQPPRVEMAPCACHDGWYYAGPPGVLYEE